MSANKKSDENHGVTAISESGEDIAVNMPGHHAIMQRGFLRNFELVQNEEEIYISNKRYLGDLFLIEESYCDTLIVMPELERKKVSIFTRMQKLRNKWSSSN